MRVRLEHIGLVSADCAPGIHPAPMIPTPLEFAARLRQTEVARALIPTVERTAQERRQIWISRDALDRSVTFQKARWHLIYRERHLCPDRQRRGLGNHRVDFGLGIAVLDAHFGQSLRVVPRHYYPAIVDLNPGELTGRFVRRQDFQNGCIDVGA
ncbi:hypothetical protein D3C73_1121370 [compost metagenome]